MFWNIYDHIARVAIFCQCFFIYQMIKNYRYAVRKAGIIRTYYHPKTLLTVPCKGLDKGFEKNITSLFLLDYDGYYLNFVVEDESDAAYERLCSLKDKLAGESKAAEINILVAGIGNSCSQKIHNLLHSCKNAPENTEVFAFADSDACLKSNWLTGLVHQLRKKKSGASTGYRWFIPERNNLATLALSALNGKIAQMLGNTGFNQAWGGSMAIRTETFRELELDKAWENAISDDLCLSYMVKKAGLKVTFVPSCLVPSYEETTWPKLFEFARRQFLITRISSPGAWWFAVFSSCFAVLGLWGGAVAAIVAAATNQANIALYTTIPVVFFAGQLIRSILRQRMIAKILPDEAARLRKAAYADIFGNCLLSWVLLGCILSSAVGRTITWRGIRYKLISPTKTVKLD